MQRPASERYLLGANEPAPEDEAAATERRRAQAEAAESIANKLRDLGIEEEKALEASLRSGVNK